MRTSELAGAERSQGWIAVFAGAIGLLMSFGSIAVYSFTVFLKPLTETFGWGRGAVSLPVGTGIVRTATIATTARE